MCGIAGFNLNPNERPVNSNRLARHLLLGIEHRGPHATGAAWRTEGGNGYVVQKRDITASKWVESLSMPKRTQTAILHTRFWTQGKPEVNDNNHPIVVGPVVGVHNGTIDNDDDLFWDLQPLGVKRQAEVDSEAIFAVLAHGAEHYKAQHDTDLLEQVSGAAAVAYMDLTGPADELHVARLVHSPLVIAQTLAGSFIFASTKDAILEACSAVGLTVEYMDDKVREGTYLRVREGFIIEDKEFTPHQGYYNSPKRWWNKPSPSGGGMSATAKADKWSQWCDHCQDFLYFCEKDGSCPGPDPAPAPAPLTVTYGTSREPDTPKGWMAVGIAETVNLFADHKVRVMGDEEFYYLYKDRAEAVEEFIERTEKNGALTTETILSILNRNHWQTRPGDWVKTTVAMPKSFADEHRSFDTWGQVVNVPPTFPYGDYLIRVILGKGKDGEDMEYALVKRKHYEFESMVQPKSLDTRVVEDTIAEVYLINGEGVMENAF